jgi:hypothetical protein
MTSLARATGVGLSNFRGNIPVYRRSFSTNALNQISERLRASSAFGDVWFRTYSQVANYPKNDAEYGKTIYISLQESTTEEKTEKVFLKPLKTL